MAVVPLSSSEVEERLAELPGWQRGDGERLVRAYRFAGHLPAAVMLLHVARIQEELDHHADLALGYDTVTVSVNTHSVGGQITALDFALARRIEEIAPAHGAR